MFDFKVTVFEHNGLISINGEERVQFLQGLITQDIEALNHHKIMWSAFLTPQGKFLNEFMVIEDQDRILLDCAAGPSMMEFGKDLRRHVLDQKVKIGIENQFLSLALFECNGKEISALEIQNFLKGLGIDFEGLMLFQDPRTQAMGWRLLYPKAEISAFLDKAKPYIVTNHSYHHLRIAQAIPDQNMDLEQEKSLLLENNFDALHAIAWDKGCYRGQELTARTKYRGLIRKILVPISYSQSLPTKGAEILSAGLVIGKICGGLPIILGGTNGLALALIQQDSLVKHLNKSESSDSTQMHLKDGEEILLYPSLPLWLSDKILKIT